MPSEAWKWWKRPYTAAMCCFFLAALFGHHWLGRHIGPALRDTTFIHHNHTFTGTHAPPLPLVCISGEPNRFHPSASVPSPRKEEKSHRKPTPLTWNRAMCRLPERLQDGSGNGNRHREPSRPNLCSTSWGSGRVIGQRGSYCSYCCP